MKKQFAKAYKGMIAGKNIEASINEDIEKFKDYHIAHICPVSGLCVVIVIWEHD